jgi:virginiamycin B lyase
VSLEFAGTIVRLDENGDTTEFIDTTIRASGAYLNPAPHGICQGPDGSIWFTGKRTSTVGRAQPGQQPMHFQLNTLAALPIFLTPGPDGNIWGTELLGSAILRVNPNRPDRVQEFPTPTPNSRPVGIIPDPQLPYLWFSEEAGRKIGRINLEGRIQEFTLPMLQPNHILGSLTFDRDLNLWVQVYIDTTLPGPAGPDYLLCIDKAIRTSTDPNLFGVAMTTHKVPSARGMLHRIKTDAAGNIWFTEMMTDRLGKVTLA